MKCESFSDWLENRDLHDVSEADRAMKHTESCDCCRDLFHKDECLSLLLSERLAPEPIPQGLKNRIDLNLDQPRLFRKKKNPWLTKVMPFAMVAMLVIYLMLPFSKSYEVLDRMGGDIIADHMKHDDSVMVVHNLDDLKAYCAANLNLTVTKPDMPANYKFIGARICTLGKHNSVHLTYNAEGKRVSVFIVKAEEVPNTLAHGESYDVVIGRHKIEYWREQDKLYAKIV